MTSSNNNGVGENSGDASTIYRKLIVSWDRCRGDNTEMLEDSTKVWDEDEVETDSSPEL